MDREIGGYAKSRGVWTQKIPAPWDLFDSLGMKREAGYVRNDVLVQIAHEVYVFWNGSSRGTRDTILHGLWLPSGEVTRIPGLSWRDTVDIAGATLR